MSFWTRAWKYSIVYFMFDMLANLITIVKCLCIEKEDFDGDGLWLNSPNGDDWLRLLRFLSFTSIPYCAQPCGRKIEEPSKRKR